MYKRADTAINLGKYQLAIKLVSKILTSLPTDARAYSIMAIANAYLQKYELAEEQIRISLSFSPENELYLGIITQIFVLKTDYNSAIKTAESILAINPKNEVALYCITISLSKLKQYKKAEKFIIYLLKLAPTDAHYHCALADIYAETKRYNLAEKSYLESLRLNPLYETALNNYAIFLYANNRKCKNEQIKELLKDALSINPTNKTIINNYNDCTKKDKPKKCNETQTVTTKELIIFFIKLITFIFIETTIIHQQFHIFIFCVKICCIYIFLYILSLKLIKD